MARTSWRTAEAAESYKQALSQVNQLDPALSARLEKGLQTLFAGGAEGATQEQLQAAVDDSNAALTELRS